MNLSATALLDPFFLTSGCFSLILAIIDKEITWSFSAKSIPLIPFDDRPLNNLSFLDINLMHFPSLVPRIMS